MVWVFSFVHPNRKSYPVQQFSHQNDNEGWPGFEHDGLLHGLQHAKEFPNAGG
jgi:hypothetical protein